MNEPGRRPRAAWWAVALAALLAGCAARPALRVATSGDYPPFTTTAADGARAGLDVAIATRLAQDLGRPLEWVPLAWPQLADAVVRAEFDVALSGVTMRADRAVIGRYARPYALTRAVPAVRAADARRWRSAADLNRAGVRIGVNAGGHLETVARQRFPRARIVALADNRLVEALAGKRVDAVVTDSAELAAWPAGPTAPVGLAPLTVDDKAPLLPADRAELAARIDDWMMAREADGWLDAERVRFLGPAAAVDAAGAARRAVAALVRLRLALMPDVAAAKRAGGRPVEDREQEKRVLDRVRAQVPTAPDRAAAVYGELIAMAKAAQASARAPADGGPSLNTLRAALGRIDETLCRELDRLPPASADAWRASLQQVGAAPAAIDRLARALAF